MVPREATCEGAANVPFWSRLRRRLRPVRDNRGQGIVELALITPILFIMIGGIFTFGVTLKDWITLTRAVGAGGRAAAVCRFNTVDPVQVVKDSAAPSVIVGNLSASWSGCGNSGTSTTVSGSYPFSISFPFLGSVKAGNLNASSTESVE